MPISEGHLLTEHLFPPNFIFEALTSLRLRWRPLRNSLILNEVKRVEPWNDRARVFMKRSTKELSPSFSLSLPLTLSRRPHPQGGRWEEHIVRRSNLQTKRKTLTRYQPCWHLDFTFYCLPICEGKKSCFLKPPIVGYFVLATWAAKHSHLPFSHQP